MLRDLLPVRDVADRLGVHVSTVYRAIERGELDAFRVSRHSYSIPLSSFRQYLENINRE